MFADQIEYWLSHGKYSFTLRELVSVLGKSDQQALMGIYRLQKKGKVISPAKGFYVIVPPEDKEFGSIPATDLIVLLMEHLKADYYVGLLSAGIYHGATHQKPSRLQVVTNIRRKKSLVFGRVAIEFIYKKDMVDLPIQDKAIDTGYLKIASPELVLYDLFKYPTHAGGLNHIATVVSELMENLDAKNFMLFAKKCDEGLWLQRLGYIVERVHPGEHDSFLNNLEEYIRLKPRRYTPLSPALLIEGMPRNDRWHIIENTNIESDI